MLRMVNKLIDDTVNQQVGMDLELVEDDEIFEHVAKYLHILT
jgi:hypothetical protein